MISLTQKTRLTPQMYSELAQFFKPQNRFMDQRYVTSLPARFAFGLPRLSSVSSTLKGAGKRQSLGAAEKAEEALSSNG